MASEQHHFRVRGGNALRGEIAVNGAEREVLERWSRSTSSQVQASIRRRRSETMRTMFTAILWGAHTSWRSCIRVYLNDHLQALVAIFISTDGLSLPAP
jgi:hypothetical protein